MNTTPSKTPSPADAPDKSTADAVTEDTAATPSGAPGAPVAANEPGAEAPAASDEPGTEAPAAADEGDAHDDLEPDEDLEPDPFTAARHGVGAGAAAVVSAALGVVALAGAWSGRVAAERETLIGQIQTSGGSSAAQQISAIYGDAWHTTALVNGVFAVLALLVGVFVLVRPAFGAPADRPQPAWVRAVALAGVALGTLGVLISVGMYFDLFLALPVAGAPAG